MLGSPGPTARALKTGGVLTRGAGQRAKKAEGPETTPPPHNRIHQTTPKLGGILPSSDRLRPRNAPPRLKTAVGKAQVVRIAMAVRTPHRRKSYSSLGQTAVQPEERTDPSSTYACAVRRPTGNVIACGKRHAADSCCSLHRLAGAAPAGGCREREAPATPDSSSTGMTTLAIPARFCSRSRTRSAQVPLRRRDLSSFAGARSGRSAARSPRSDLCSVFARSLQPQTGRSEPPRPNARNKDASSATAGPTQHPSVPEAPCGCPCFSSSSVAVREATSSTSNVRSTPARG